jgi:hypothetical protein
MNLNLLDPKLIALAAVAILLVVVLAWLYVRRRRNTTADLRKKFGPEYDRAVLTHGSERRAQAKLEDREKRVEKLNIRDLDPMERERFLKRWESVQSRFVDSPKGAIPYPISISAPPTFLSTILKWWRTTGLRTRLRCGSGKTQQPRKT